MFLNISNGWEDQTDCSVVSPTQPCEEQTDSKLAVNGGTRPAGENSGEMKYCSEIDHFACYSFVSLLATQPTDQNRPWIAGNRNPTKNQTFSDQNNFELVFNILDINNCISYMKMILGTSTIYSQSQKQWRIITTQKPNFKKIKIK